MSLPQNYEPAVRDPKKLRRTALILVAIMVIGGWLVMKAYNNYVTSRAGDDRPAIVHRIQPERSLRVVRQDGELADLMDLRNKVVALHVIHLDQLEDSARSLDALKRLTEAYPEESDLRFVTLVLNPGDSDEVVGKLSKTAVELGVKLPRWWVASTEPETLRKFIRKELKPNVPPAELDGHWEFDPSVVLIDRNGHIRHAVVPKLDRKTGEAVSSKTVSFDFDQAAKWDEEGLSEGIEASNVEALEQLLIDTSAKLVAEPYQPGQGTGTSIMLVAGGVGLFLATFVAAIFVFRSKRSKS